MSTQTYEAETFRKLQPQEYLRKFLLKEVRPDGRELKQFRQTTVNLGCISTTNGSSLVRVGNTTVVCGIKAEVSIPRQTSIKEGYLVPNVELSPMCSPKFKPGPPSEHAQVLNLNTLCIHEGAAVWVLYADIVCVNYDGNVFDACVIGLITALSNVKLPKATFIEEEGLVKATEELLIPLNLSRLPYPATFSIFDGGHRQYFLVDPTEVEESVAHEVITIICDEAGQICTVWKVGGISCTPKHLKKCISIARERYAEIAAIVENEEKSNQIK
ncbi:4119_t:CDS:2 [Diversispora eburnea]|uniref:Ribosomal RNA-processing protein 43 n=1 Tax=Diversispora eburnea TaxID=1213867 RepID=A0A9N8YRP3_9GLOM|nr:4119_t:CDS:2 [Diversispora eburnea]